MVLMNVENVNELLEGFNISYLIVKFYKDKLINVFKGRIADREDKLDIVLW